ncbi:hypothetical protein MUP59_05840 [Candidatus Bathyarchaeota archaeon]|nr:hypothetical protein [Candidatus Bathyarchaeota archaeon]
MRFGFTLDGYEILAIKKLVKPIPSLAKAWAVFESNHYKKHIKYQVSDVMVHVRIDRLYHTNLFVQNYCDICATVWDEPLEVSRKNFKAFARDGEVNGNIVYLQLRHSECADYLE